MTVRNIFVLLAVAAVASALGWVFWVDPAICNGCGLCVNVCSEDAIYMSSGDAVIDPVLCNGCGICAQVCPRNAISRMWYQGIEDHGLEEVAEIMPNPTTGSLIVSGIPPGEDVTVMSICGRAAISGMVSSSGSVALDLEGLPGGIYIVTVDGRSMGHVTLID